MPGETSGDMSMAVVKPKAPAIAVRNQIRAEYNGSAPPINPNIAPSKKVQIPLRSDAFQQVDSYLTRFTGRKAKAILRGLEALTDVEQVGERPYFALPDIVRERGLRGTDELFNPLTGSLTVAKGEHEDASSPFAGFFTRDRTFRHDGKVELRGPSFYIGLAKQLPYSARLDIMQRDIADGVKFISEADRNTVRTPEDFVYYQAILDYLKVHTTTLFHAVTFNERRGRVPSGVIERGVYMQRKANIAQAMTTLTRMQYQHFLGLEFDQGVDLQHIGEQLGQVLGDLRVNMSHVEQRHGKGAANERFRFPEVHHPLVIALGAHEAVNNNPQTDVVVGIPTGGTEAAIVTQMLYEQKTGKVPDMFFLPLSLHSRVNKSIDHEANTSLANSIINENYTEPLAGKSVLLVDDNSSTGSTLSDISHVLEERGVRQINTFTAEFDSRRWRKPNDEYVFEENGNYFNPNASRSTMGIAEIGMSQQDKVLRHVFIDTIRGRLAKEMVRGRDEASQQPLNASSRGETETERMLSNFAGTPIVVDGKRYASVESFWQSLYYPEQSAERAHIAEMDGPQAKRAGVRKPRGIGYIEYEGKHIPVGSAEHHALMRRALEAKFEQSETARFALLKTGKRPITHVIKTKDGRPLRDSQSIPGEVLSGMLMSIRDELHKNGVQQRRKRSR